MFGRVKDFFKFSVAWSSPPSACSAATSPQITCCAQRANLCEKVSPQATCCAQRANLCEKVSPQVTCSAQRANLNENVSPPQIFAKRCCLLPTEGKPFQHFKPLSKVFTCCAKGLLCKEPALPLKKCLASFSLLCSKCKCLPEKWLQWNHQPNTGKGSSNNGLSRWAKLPLHEEAKGHWPLVCVLTPWTR